MFQTIVHARREVSPLFLSFAVEANPENAINMSINFLDTDELEDRCENIEKRLRALGNLLEIQHEHVGSEGHVRVMHLTVKEFLLRADVQQKLAANTATSTLDTNVALLSACLTMIKSVLHSSARWNDEIRWDIAEDAMRYAAHAERTTGVPWTRLLTT